MICNASFMLSLQEFFRQVYLPLHPDMRASSISQVLMAIRLVERWAGCVVTIGEFTDGMLRDFLLDYASRVEAPTVNSKWPAPQNLIHVL
jgi:hypothetical protein